MYFRILKINLHFINPEYFRMFAYYSKTCLNCTIVVQIKLCNVHGCAMYSGAQWRRVYGGQGRHVPHQKCSSLRSMRHGASSHFFCKVNNNDFLGELLLTN